MQYDNTALIFAAYYGHLHVVQELITAGANVRIKDKVTGDG